MNENKRRIVLRQNKISGECSFHVQRMEYINPMFSDEIRWMDCQYINHDGKLVYAIFQTQAQAETFVKMQGCPVEDKVLWEGEA